jgi:hypothetical protein
MISFLKVYNDKIEDNRLKYLKIIDPFNHGIVNFSETVDLFNSVNYNIKYVRK